MSTSDIESAHGSSYATIPTYTNINNWVFGFFLFLRWVNNLAGESETSPEDSHPLNDTEPRSIPPSPRRYFIMKCLSHREIEWSTRNNLWITQKHNEIILNEAIKAHPPCIFHD